MEAPKDQPPLWSAKPDVTAFEKIENTRLEAAQHAIDQVLAVTESRTIENTLVPYDEAIQQLNAAIYFSSLMQQVHPDVVFRDHATAMTTKVSSSQTALSLNRDVYRALTSLDLSKTDPATRYYVQWLVWTRTMLLEQDSENFRTGSPKISRCSTATSPTERKLSR